jgi:three-Cys-motif partner protein
MKSIDMFLNFPVMDMNRNVLWRDVEKIPPAGIHRMNRFWGDESWRQVAYTSDDMLFDDMLVKQDSKVIVDAYRKRLREVAGFDYVSGALPMRNSMGATVYYLLLASQKEVAADIVNSIFDKYRDRSG